MTTSRLRTAVCLAVVVNHACASPSSTTGATPKRIISLVPSVTDIVLAMGRANSLVARTNFDHDSRLKNLPSVGGATNPNLELIVRLQPGLVLTWDDSAAPGLTRKLVDVRIPSLALRTSSLDDLQADIRTIGEILGARRTGDSLWGGIEDSLKVVSARTAGFAKPRVFFLVWRRPLMTVGRNSFIDTLITVAGGRNIFGDDGRAWPTVSLESVGQRGVDVIVIPISNAEAKRDAIKDSQLKRLVGLTRARVAFVEADLVDRPGPRLGEAAHALAAAIRVQ